MKTITMSYIDYMEEINKAKNKARCDCSDKVHYEASCIIKGLLNLLGDYYRDSYEVERAKKWIKE